MTRNVREKAQVAIFTSMHLRRTPIDVSNDWKRPVSCASAALLLHTGALGIVPPTDRLDVALDVQPAQAAVLWDITFLMEQQSPEPEQAPAEHSPTPTQQAVRFPRSRSTPKTHQPTDRGATAMAQKQREGDSIVSSLRSDTAWPDHTTQESSAGLVSPKPQSAEEPEALGGTPTGEVPTANSEPAGLGALGSNSSGVRGSGPRLLVKGKLCAGYFPAGSRVQRGRVRITVHVSPKGNVVASRVLMTTPVGSDFAQAATACVSRLRFVPARDEVGLEIQSQTTLELDFFRN